LLWRVVCYIAYSEPAKCLRRSAEVAGERVLFETEGIRAVQTFSGHVPGLTSGGSKQLYLGAFAVTDRRVVGATRAGKAVDVAYDMQADGPATLTLEPDGLHVV
jgi:hypothetical protein